jgi:hypothetical protein
MHRMTLRFRLYRSDTGRWRRGTRKVHALRRPLELRAHFGTGHDRPFFACCVAGVGSSPAGAGDPRPGRPRSSERSGCACSTPDPFLRQEPIFARRGALHLRTSRYFAAAVEPTGGPRGVSHSHRQRDHTLVERSLEPCGALRVGAWKLAFSSRLEHPGSVGAAWRPC